MSENDRLQEFEISKTKTLLKIIFGIVGTVFLGAIGSGLWDILFKPGIGSISRFITGLSQSIDDAVFSSAALDPTSLSSLICVYSLSIIPYFLLGFFVVIGFIAKPLMIKMEKDINQIKTKAPEKIDNFYNRRIKISSFVAIIFCFILLFFSITIKSVINESVYVWRIFHKNIDVCGPFITQHQRNCFIADFRNIKNRNDFEKLKKELSDCGKNNKINLEW